MDAEGTRVRSVSGAGVSAGDAGQLEDALREGAWSAALEQTVDASKLPPAVILDIDETVLDNSYYQAQQVRD